MRALRRTCRSILRDLPILRLQARGGVRRFLEATDGMSRKPPQWMRRFAPEGNPAHLFPVVCSCGRWIFSERDVVWQSWDAGIIEGDDLVTAIILDRPLIRIRHVSHMDIVRLETVAGPLGISPDGQYLGAHECGLMPVSVKPAEVGDNGFHYSTLPGFPKTRPVPGNPDPWAGLPVNDLSDFGWPQPEESEQQTLF